MKKKYWLGIWLFVVVGVLSILLYRSWWDRSSLAIEDPLIAVDDVYWSPHEINEIDQASVKEALEDIWFSTEQFFDAYQQALDSRDTYLKQNIAETLFSKYWDTRMLPVLVLLSMQQNDVIQALEYLTKANVNDVSFIKTVGAHTIVNILLNTTKLDDTSLDRVKNIVNNYYDNNHINEADKYYYYSLLALAKNDRTHFDHYSEFLKWWSYKDRYDTIQKAKETTKSYEYAPEYYFEGLLWIELFYEWWYNFAHQRWTELLKKDDDYLLAYQLQAYSSLLLSKRQQASEIFERIKLKSDNDLYILLQAISQYQNQIYTESILLLKQITSEEYSLDALRYLILSYNEISDRKWVYGVLENLVWYELTPYDYFSLFDLLLFKETETLSQEERDLIDDLIKQCHWDIWNKQWFICLYWKAWLMYVDKNYEKALPLMNWLTEWYPTSTVFERIWDVAYKSWNPDLAKKSFLKAFASSRDDTELNYLRNRVTNLLKE